MMRDLIQQMLLMNMKEQFGQHLWLAKHLMRIISPFIAITKTGSLIHRLGLGLVNADTGDGCAAALQLRNIVDR